MWQGEARRAVTSRSRKRCLTLPWLALHRVDGGSETRPNIQKLRIVLWWSTGLLWNKGTRNFWRKIPKTWNRGKRQEQTASKNWMWMISVCTGWNTKHWTGAGKPGWCNLGISAIHVGIFFRSNGWCGSQVFVATTTVFHCSSELENYQLNGPKGTDDHKAQNIHRTLRCIR